MFKDIIFACFLAVVMTGSTWARHPDHDMGDQREMDLALQNAISSHARLVDDFAELNLMSDACEQADEFAGLQESAFAVAVRYNALLRPSAQHEPLHVLIENRMVEDALPDDLDCDATRLEENAQSIRNTITRFERAIDTLEAYVSRAQAQSQPY